MSFSRLLITVAMSKRGTYASVAEVKVVGTCAPMHQMRRAMRALRRRR
jgi:hypothetical protein